MSNEVGNDISPVRVHVDTGDLCNVQIMYNAFKYQARLYALYTRSEHVNKNLTQTRKTLMINNVD